MSEGYYFVNQSVVAVKDTPAAEAEGLDRAGGRRGDGAAGAKNSPPKAI